MKLRHLIEAVAMTAVFMLMAMGVEAVAAALAGVESTRESYHHTLLCMLVLRVYLIVTRPNTQRGPQL